MDAWRVVLGFALHDLPPSRQAAVAGLLRANKGRLEAASAAAVERHADDRETHGSRPVSGDRAPAATR
jgi:hypothetical protein